LNTIGSRCSVSAILVASTYVMSNLFTYLSLQSAHTCGRNMLVRCYNSATTNTIVEIRPLSVSPFVMAPQIQLRDSGSAVNPPPQRGKRHLQPP